MAYREMWEMEVRHFGLNKYRHIRGSDRYVVEQKAAAQKLAWDEMWERKQAAELKKREREAAIRSKEEKKQLAIVKTDEAQKALDDLESTLKHALSVDDAIDWSSLLDKKPFPKNMPSKPSAEAIPDEPKSTDKKYQPSLGLLDKIFSGLRKRKQDEAESLFVNDHKSWVEKRKRIERNNKEQEVTYSKSVELWKKEKANYEEKQQSNNSLIQERKEQYFNKEADAIHDYCEMVLSNSVYPDYFPQQWDIEYQPETKIIIVDYGSVQNSVSFHYH